MRHLIATLLLAAALAAAHAQPPRKCALLIGIGQYAEGSGWASLNASTGTQLMREALLRHGFQSTDVFSLADANATRAGIGAAFERFIEAAKPGDVAVFHFYGHGDRLKDDDKNEEIDGFDEAIVPYDGKKLAANGGRNLIRDDELGHWLDLLRQKIGPAGQVLALLDACYSGSGFRSNDQSERKNAKQNSLAMPDGAFDENEKAPLTAFFSSRPNEPSFEEKISAQQFLAPLTWAFCQNLQNLQPESTYRGMFEQISTEILSGWHRHQHPQSEGNLDLRVFGQRVAPPPPYFRAVFLPGESEIELLAGQIQGLLPGTRIALFPPETRDTSLAKPLARGLVSESEHGLLRCRARLDRALDETALDRAWVFVSQRNFNGYDLPLRLAVAEPALASLLRQSLADLPAIRLDAPAPELSLNLEKKSLTLRRTNADSLKPVWKTEWNPEKPEAATKALREALGNYLQANFLRNLNFKGSPIRTDFAARPEKSPNEQGLSPILSLRKERDFALLTVANRSKKNIFYTVIDIDARNVVKVLLPTPTRSPAEYSLAPGESREHRVTFDAPGREVLKLIATPSPIDLRETIETRGGGGSAGKSFFENLFSQTFLREGKTSQRAGPTETYLGTEAGVETLVIEVE